MKEITQFNSYFEFINSIDTRINDYDHQYEQHHIIPKSCGGTDDKDNLIQLSHQEHVLAHEKLYQSCCDLLKTVGHQLKSILGHAFVNSDIDYNELDNISNHLQILNKQKSKKTIAKLDTLEIQKINGLNPVPAGWIEVVFENVPKIRVVNLKHYEYGIKRWPKNVEIPAGWFSLKSLSKLKYNEVAKHFGLKPKAIVSQASRKQKYCWIHNIHTHKNKLVPVNSPFPDGEWIGGLYLSPRSREAMRKGGQSAKEKYYGNAKSFKCVYDLELRKRRYIRIDEQCPESCVEIKKEDNALTNVELDQKYLKLR